MKLNNNTLIIEDMKEEYDYIIKWSLPSDISFKRIKNKEFNTITMTVDNVSKHLGRRSFVSISELKHNINNGNWRLKQYYPLMEINKNNKQKLSKFVLIIGNDTQQLPINVPYGEKT